MSRTKRGSKHSGTDSYGGRYNCNKTYNSGLGNSPKDLAHSQLRNESKELLGESISEMWVDELVDGDFQVTPEQMDELVEYCRLKRGGLNNA